MRRIAGVGFVALLAFGCVDAYREHVMGPLNDTPAVLHLDPDACLASALPADGPLTSNASSTRLRKITDARTIPARVGAMHDFNKLDPIPLFQEPNAPLEIALARCVARALATSQAPDLVVADITLREAWVESRAAKGLALRGQMTASFVFSVDAIVLEGRKPSVEFRGTASGAHAYSKVARHEAQLQAAFCDAVGKFEAWLAARPQG